MIEETAKCLTNVKGKLLTACQRENSPRAGSAKSEFSFSLVPVPVTCVFGVVAATGCDHIRVR